MSNENENEINSTSQTGWKKPLDAFPILQFVGAGGIGLAATWTTVQLTQNSE